MKELLLYAACVHAPAAPQACIEGLASLECHPAYRRCAASSGVESFDVSLEQQRVVVKGNVTPEAVLQTVSKTGKKAELVQ